MILIGASGHAKVILDILVCNGIAIERILDDKPRCKNIYGVPVANCADHIITEETEAVISIGNNYHRKNKVEQVSCHFVTAIHRDSYISQFAHIEDGTVVMANACINPGVFIGRHCIINTGAVVEHDCVLGDYVHVSPNAALAGNVVVGEGTHIGIGASVIQGVTIGKWVTVGAGAVIIRDIPDNATVVGNPGRIIQREISLPATHHPRLKIQKWRRKTHGLRPTLTKTHKYHFSSLKSPNFNA